MKRTEKEPGSRALRLPDWPFGSHGRRLFLEALLDAEAPIAGWRKTELEGLVEVERGGVDRLLAGALALGLIKQSGLAWKPADPEPALAAPLRQLVAISSALPDRKIDSIPKRRYNKSDS